jgi:hypothetical protein
VKQACFDQEEDLIDYDAEEWIPSPLAVKTSNIGSIVPHWKGFPMNYL